MSLDSIKFTRADADIIYGLLMRLGATKDIKFNWNEESGRIHIMKSFYYESGVKPISGDDSKKMGQQYYTLDKYIQLLIRWDRAAYKRMKNVENKINQMYASIEALKKQL